jgi:hypothetical protein
MVNITETDIVAQPRSSKARITDSPEDNTQLDAKAGHIAHIIRTSGFGLPFVLGLTMLTVSRMPEDQPRGKTHHKHLATRLREAIRSRSHRR